MIQCPSLCTVLSYPIDTMKKITFTFEIEEWILFQPPRKV
jgi:hypothetical protein